MGENTEIIRQRLFKTENYLGDFDPDRQGGYDQLDQVSLFGCVWESKIDDNVSAPATWDGGDVITPNTQDWKRVSGDYEAWLLNKDKPATTGTTGDHPYNGMGRVVLKKNMVNIAGEGEEPNIVNLLTQSAFEDSDKNPITNTIYVIKYDFTLGEDITVPENCVLEFEGGSITADGENKDTLSGNFLIKAEDVLIFDGINVDEAANNRYINVKWFGAKGDDTHDDTEAIKKAVIGKYYVTVFFPCGVYKITDTIDVFGTTQTWIGGGNNGIYSINESIKEKFASIHCSGVPSDNGIFIYAPAQIRDMLFYGDLSHGTIGIIVGKPYNFTGNIKFNNVGVTGFTKGIHLESVYCVIFERCRITGNDIGIYVMQRHRNGETTHGFMTSVDFISCRIYGNYKYAYLRDWYSAEEIYNPDSANVRFTSCSIEQNGAGRQGVEATNVEIMCKTFEQEVSAISMGRMTFTTCGGEGIGNNADSVFISSYKGTIVFTSCEFWSKKLLTKDTYISIKDSRFPNLVLKTSENGGNYSMAELDKLTLITTDLDAPSVNSANYMSINRSRYGQAKLQDLPQSVGSNYFMGDIYPVLSGDYQRTLAIPFAWDDGTQAGKRDWFDPLGDRIVDKKVGTTSERPTPSDLSHNTLRRGFQFFDTDLSLPVIWNGSKWINIVDNNVFAVLCPNNWDFKLISIDKITGNETGTFVGVAVIENGKAIIINKNEISTGNWSSTNTLVGAEETYATLVNDFDGKQKTDAIIQSLGSNAPMAKAASEYGVAGTALVAGKWWLPSMGELLMIYSHLKTVNAILSVLGGDLIGLRVPSSSERSQGSYWYLHTDEGIRYYLKSDGIDVRPVTTFTPTS